MAFYDFLLQRFYENLNTLLVAVMVEGHSCKIGNMRCPGTLKNQNPQFE